MGEGSNISDCKNFSVPKRCSQSEGLKGARRVEQPDVGEVKKFILKINENFIIFVNFDRKFAVFQFFINFFS